MLGFTKTGVALMGFVVLGSAFGLHVVNAQKISLPKVPDAIQVHSNEEVVLVAHASGSQIYTCLSAEDNKFIWILKAPDAELRDQKGNVIGSHFAGPSWKLNDGSEVTGKAVARADSDDPNSIPWLLVDVIGGVGGGLLMNVRSIQRINTHGGMPPATGCDGSHLDEKTKSPYTADYYFYTRKQKEKQSLATQRTSQPAIHYRTGRYGLSFSLPRYGFTFSLPKSWKGYSVVVDQWEGSNTSDPDGDQAVPRGPLVIVKYPRPTEEDAPQNISIMVFTHAQWDSLEQGNFAVSAASVGPGELGRNRRYVFAEPPRDLNPDVPGYEETLTIMHSNPLHAF